MDGLGECIELDGFSEVLCMAWKQDNNGPQDPNEASTVCETMPYSSALLETTMPSQGLYKHPAERVSSLRRNPYPLQQSRDHTQAHASRYCDRLNVHAAWFVELQLEGQGDTAACSCLQVMNIFNITQRNFPGAAVQASTLDAFFEKLLEAAPHADLPVVTGEIGDSWIYGGIRFWEKVLLICVCI